MTLVWLLVWVCCDAPPVDFDPLNAWAVGLAVCVLIDVLD